jgi:hypothetical protein
MKTQPNSYNGYRYSGEIISYTVWLYHRFTLSFRDIEDLLAERGIVVTYGRGGRGVGSIFIAYNSRPSPYVLLFYQ